MNLKAFTIISLIFIGFTIFSINSTYSADERYIYNDSFEEIHLEKNSWCRDMRIIFQIYNKSDYENMDYINEREYYSIRNMSDAEVKIHNGPFEINDLLLDTKTNKTGGFTYEFNKTGIFLLEIFVKKQKHFNTYTELLEIVDCGKREEAMKYNITFEYPKFKAEVIANKTNMNDSSNITIKNINTKKDNRFKDINGTIKAYNIELTQRSFYKNLYLVLDIDLTENQSIETFGFDQKEKNNWTKINSELNSNKTKLTINITDNKLIYYEKKIIKPNINNDNNKNKDNITESSKQNTTEENINANNNESINNQNSNSQTNNTTNTQKNEINETNPIISGNNNVKENKTFLTPFNVIAVAIPTLIILIVIFIKISKKRASINTKPYKDDKNVTHLRSYKQIYENAKKYVEDNKNYGKDAVSQGLKSANVPKDLIEKILKEEFSN